MSFYSTELENDSGKKNGFCRVLLGGVAKLPRESICLGFLGAWSVVSDGELESSEEQGPPGLPGI